MDTPTLFDLSPYTHHHAAQPDWAIDVAGGIDPAWEKTADEVWRERISLRLVEPHTAARSKWPQQVLMRVDTLPQHEQLQLAQKHILSLQGVLGQYQRHRKTRRVDGGEGERRVAEDGRWHAVLATL